MRSAYLIGIAAFFVACGSPVIELRPATTVDAGVLPRLFVSSSSGLSVWNRANALSTDASPSAQLSVIGPHRMTTDGERVVVAQSGGLAIFDAPRTLGSEAVPAATISYKDFPSPGDAISLSIGGGDLWVVYGPAGGVARLPNLSTLTSSSVPAAFFIDRISKLEGAAYDPVSRKLFGGTFTSNVLMVFNEADTKTGTTTIFDDVISKLTQPHLVIADGTLLATNYDGTTLNMWSGLSTIALITPPTATITTGLTVIKSMSLHHDVLLLAGSTAVGAVGLYRSASTLVTRMPSAPDAIVTHTSLEQVLAATLGSDDVLYALDANGVSIFKNASTGAVFVTEITSSLSTPRALVLIE